MRAILTPVPPAERDDRIAAYADFLAARDGVPDFERQTLSRREEKTRDFERLAPAGAVSMDTEAFDALLASGRVPDDLPDDVRLLSALVKTNANEAFAVDRSSARPSRLEGVSADIERIVLLEERYHTRLLVSSAAAVGIEVRRRVPPVRSVRAIIGVIADLPAAASRPTTLAGEAVGILTFLRTVGAIRRVFASRPSLRDALEERVTEVLVDEVGHLSFNRLLATRAQLAAARFTLPLVALGTRGALPEAEALGVLPVPLDEVARFDFDGLPAEVRRRAFVA